MNSLVGVAAPSDSVGSILVEILHIVEGGDVEQGCSNLETNLPCLLFSLYLSLVFISCMLTLLIFYMLELKLLYVWDCLLTLVFCWPKGLPL